MPPANVTYSSFLQGVSKQSETQRRDGTAAEIVNAYADIARGLTKRNGMEYQYTLSGLTAPTDDYDIFWLETGGGQFVMFLSDDATEPIQIFDLSDGSKATIDYTAAAGAKTYLSTVPASRGYWRVLSVFDSTIIANTDKTVALTGSASPYTITHTKVDFTELVTDGNLVYANQGDYVELLNSNTGYPAGFYRIVTAASSGDFDNSFPKLIRQPSPDANSQFDDTTMPIQLLYDGAGTFDVVIPEWAPRYSGDSATSPGPSFVGRKIDDIVFYNQRLWIFADETANASSTTDVFNYWQNDITVLTAADPIDELISDEGLNKIRYAVPFRRSLNIFTEGNRQFEIRSDGPLAADSISIIPTTNYGVSPNIRPIKLGGQMYFFTEFSDYAQMYEYYYLENAANNTAEDTTLQVQRYITEEPVNMTGEVNNGLIIAHAEDTLDAFTYKFLWSGDEKLQNAWSKWTIADADYTIKSSRVFNDYVWMLLHTDGNDEGPTERFLLCRIPVQNRETDTDLPYSIHLDFLVRKASGTGTYNAGTNTTYWDLPYYHSSITAIPTSGDTAGMAETATVTQQSEHVARVTLTGDWSTTDFTFGVPFLFSVELNPPYVKDNNGNPITGSFAMKKLIMYIRDTVQFDIVQAVPGLSSDTTKPYTAAQMSADQVEYNKVPVTDFDNPSFIVLGKADTTTLTVQDTSEFPITLVSSEFRGTFNARRPVG